MGFSGGQIAIADLVDQEYRESQDLEEEGWGDGAVEAFNGATERVD